MPAQLEIPRSGDERLAAIPDRPLDLEAGPTIEVDPPFRINTNPIPKPAPAPTPAVEPAASVAPAPIAESSAAAPGADPTAPAPANAPAVPQGPRLRRTQKRGRTRWDAPAWLVSALIHLGIIGGLAAVATSSSDVVAKLANLDSALVPNTGAEKELTPILADPTNTPREQALGDVNADSADPNMAFSPSTSRTAGAVVLKSTGRAVGERTALPSVSTVVAPSNISMVSTMPTRDLGNGGLIGGDVTHGVGDVGDALDQIAREILRHLSQHKVTVVWLFDESESMRDDQKAIKSKFDRVVNELKVNTPDVATDATGKRKKGDEPPLNHAIVGFGDDVHYEQEKPTADINAIGRAIDRLRVDSTGTENTMSAVGLVIKHYENLITSDRRLLVVLATDESGDDGDLVEEARQTALKNKVPIYVIGRQSLFGTNILRIAYVDPVTKDTYWVGIKRGPETADFETLQIDGLHDRRDEQPSGFAPYEMARLTKDTGGIYFLLPSEEELRVRRREKAYSIADLKEYVPDYESRMAYAEHRDKSELRRTLREIIALTKDFPFRHHYSVIVAEMLQQVEQDLPVVSERLNAHIAIEKRLRGLQKARDRETDKRWQAAYDLMLAQVVVYQIKAYEYRANLLEMAAKVPQAKAVPSPELTVHWALDHDHEAKAPKESTEKVYAEAMHLLKQVIERHPHTPWSDLAQDEINRGFSIKRHEWHLKHSPRYEERSKLVPKF